VQGLFPLVFVILFLSSAFFPDNLMVEPAATVAEYNPLSFIVEGIRDPVISSLSWDAFWKAMGSLALVGAIGIGLSALALRRRLRTGG
jgi:ABC-2 type transport system permease protein